MMALQTVSTKGEEAVYTIRALQDCARTNHFLALGLSIKAP